MLVYHRLPSRHVEPCMVRFHDPHRSAQFHGRERSNPREHRDVRLHGYYNKYMIKNNLNEQSLKINFSFFFPEKTAVSSKPGLQPQG